MFYNFLALFKVCLVEIHKYILYIFSVFFIIFFNFQCHPHQYHIILGVVHEPVHWILVVWKRNRFGRWCSFVFKLDICTVIVSLSVFKRQSFLKKDYITFTSRCIEHAFMFYCIISMQKSCFQKNHCSLAIIIKQCPL